MIKNDKQLKAGKERLLGWRDSFNKMEQSLDPESFKVYRLTHEPIVSELEKEIHEYELLKFDREETPYFSDPMEVGPWIVRQRLRKNVTQAILAKRLRTSQAQISREEDAEFRNSPLMRIYEIMQAFGYPVFEMGFFKNKEEMVSFNTNKLESFQTGSNSSTNDLTSPIDSSQPPTIYQSDSSGLPKVISETSIGAGR